MSTFNKIVGPIFLLLPSNNRVERIWKLAQVDFKKRYYNDKLGVVWALLNPAFKIAIYYFVFKVVFNSREENFALFLFSGLIIWMLFKEITTKGLHTFRTKKYLIESIQFEKTDLFISNSISVLLGFLFNLSAYLIISLIIGIPIHFEIVYLPILVLSVILLASGCGLILSIIQLYLKDIVHMWDVLIMIGFWSSGVFFSADIYFEKFPILVYINPFIGIMMHARCALLSGGEPMFWLLGLNLIISFSVYFLGIFIFKKYMHHALEKI